MDILKQIDESLADNRNAMREHRLNKIFPGITETEDLKADELIQCYYCDSLHNPNAQECYGICRQNRLQDPAAPVFLGIEFARSMTLGSTAHGARLRQDGHETGHIDRILDGGIVWRSAPPAVDSYQNMAEGDSVTPEQIGGALERISEAADLEYMRRNMELWEAIEYVNQSFGSE